MTPQSIAIALTATLLTGLLGGWLFRDRARPGDWSFALSAVIGLLVFRVSNAGDLVAELIPSSAIGWLPWICLAVAGVQAIPSRKLRIVGAMMLGFAIPLRLLWGSIYLNDSIPSLKVLITIAAWSLSIATAILINAPVQRGRFSVDVIGWTLLVASSVLVIVATGSVTYAVATGIVGVAVVANLIGASRLPIQGTAILSCLIGLSVAFSETPLPLGVALILTALAISWLSQESAPQWKHPRLVRLAIQVPLFFVAAIPVAKLLEPPSDVYGGYQSVPNETVRDSGATQLPSVEAQSFVGGKAKEIIDGSDGAPITDDPESEALLDPFAGFLP